MSTRLNALLQRATLLAARAAQLVTRTGWVPDFTDMRPIIAGTRGQPIAAFIRRGPGDEIAVNPLRWYNGHPGEHTVAWRCDPPDAIEWTRNQFGIQYGIVRREGTFAGIALVPSTPGEPDSLRTFYATQTVRLQFAPDYEGTENA